MPRQTRSRAKKVDSSSPSSNPPKNNARNKEKVPRAQSIIDYLDRINMDWHVVIKKRRYDPVTLISQTKMSVVYKVVCEDEPDVWRALKLMPNDKPSYQYQAKMEYDYASMFKGKVNVIQVEAFSLSGHIVSHHDHINNYGCTLMLMPFADQSIESFAAHHNRLHELMSQVNRIDTFSLPSSSSSRLNGPIKPARRHRRRTSAQQQQAMFSDMQTAKFIFKQMVQCVALCHSERLIHRDIKPKNFVMMNGLVTLIDFGLSIYAEDRTEPLVAYDTVNVGTPKFMAPEVRYWKDNPKRKRPEYYETGAHVDVYALGMTLAVMVLDEQLIRAPKHFNHISDESLRLLLEGCLEEDMERRWTIKDIQSCDWLNAN